VEDSPTTSLPAELAPFHFGFDLFDDGSLIAIPLPGHTRGQIGILFRRTDHRYIFMVADACWSKGALTQDQPPSWLASRVFDNNINYLRTFGFLREVAVRPEAPIMVPSHCEQTWKNLRHESD
jgi:glyoxylase-like metal-dependent hydrolase (beta-lactamase superfamily II)